MGLVPHALHVVQVGGLDRVWLLGEQQGLLHATLGVVQPQQSPDTLRIQVPVGQIHASHLLVPLGRLLKVARVPVDPRLAGIDLHQRWRVLDGAVGKLQGLGRLAEEVIVVSRNHAGEEQAGRRLLIGHEAGLHTLPDLRAKPRDLLIQVLVVLKEQFLHKLGLPFLEVQGLHRSEQRGHALAHLRAHVGVQPRFESVAGDEVQDQLLQGVGLRMISLQIVEELADSFLLLLCQRHKGLVHFAPLLVQLPADGHPLGGPRRVRGMQPAPDRHAFWMHGLRKGGDRGRHRGLLQLLAVELLPWLHHSGLGQRRPEAVELRLVGHIGEHVGVVLRILVQKSSVDLRGLAVALQEHAKPALGLLKVELVDGRLFMLLQALQGLLELATLLHDLGLVQDKLGLIIGQEILILERLLVVV
mmetsp:Transcript_147285/g.473131  ORF Transcript_147285/g.473131 Transcript_147285/m.473131 type:complete len:415 (-) Transcript_147285:617-1861(-)